MFGLEFGETVALARRGELLATRAPEVANARASQASGLAQWLKQVWPADESRELWVATGPGLDAAAMGELLRVLRAADFSVQGFVDHVAVVAGWQRLPGQTIAAQLEAQQLLISVVSNDGHATELQRTVRLPGGSARLQDAWLRLGAQTLVQQTRFDPLHDRHHEAALRAAHRDIHIETFIFGAGDVGQRFADLLAQKRKQGIEVRVLYDSLGSRDTPRDFFEKLRQQNVEVREFRPLNPVKTPEVSKLQDRDHR